MLIDGTVAPLSICPDNACDCSSDYSCPYEEDRLFAKMNIFAFPFMYKSLFICQIFCFIGYLMRSLSHDNVVDISSSVIDETFIFSDVSLVRLKFHFLCHT